MPRSLLPLVFSCASFLAGCATGPDPRDPYEGFNRKVFSFNERVDKIVLKPKKTNIDVKALVLAWAPHGVDAGGVATAAW